MSAPRDSARLSRTDGASFTAYRRTDGRVGVRNRVLVVPSVICSHIVAERIADAHDDAVAAPHDHGCGQIGDDHDRTERTLVNLARNPNVAGATVVGLGCEHLQSGPFAERIGERGMPVRETAIQDAGGTDPCVEDGVDATADLVAAADSDRTTATPSDLTVGVVSSDLDESTRAIADPTVGTAVDAMVDAGANVVIAGTERLAPHTESAADRAEEPSVANSIREIGERQKGRPGDVRRITRHAADAPFDELVGAWGSTDVGEVIPYGAAASTGDGLTLVDSPSRFEEAATALAAAGASVILHVTADGEPTGHPVVPVLKVTGNEDTMESLGTDIDVDANEADVGAVLDEIVRVADGGLTASEDHGITAFAISRSGPSM